MTPLYAGEQKHLKIWICGFDQIEEFKLGHAIIFFTTINVVLSRL